MRKTKRNAFSELFISGHFNGLDVVHEKVIIYDEEVFKKEDFEIFNADDEIKKIYNEEITVEEE